MAGDQVLLRVLDQGPGLSEEDPQQLFELFYRSPSTARSRPGAGIGLYVCRILIEAMGGRIWARTRPEGGSEFGVSLPVFEEQIRETGRAAATVG
jgi:NtrC-family two-component system sensor histidine kinase KinB